MSHFCTICYILKTEPSLPSLLRPLHYLLQCADQEIHCLGLTLYEEPLDPSVFLVNIDEQIEG